MKAKEYDVLSMAVEEGVSYGLIRAYKYEDNPSDEHIKMVVIESVLNSIAEWFNFEELDDEIRR